MTTFAIEARLNVFALPCFIAHCMERGWVGLLRPATETSEHRCPCGAYGYRQLPDKSWTCRECEAKDLVAVELLAEVHTAHQPEVEDD